MALGLCAVDVALRPWRPRRQALSSATYLLLAYLPLWILPSVGPTWLACLSGAVALAALVNMSRLVGLTLHPAFFVPTLVATASFFFVARVGWYGLYQALPAFAIFLVLATSTLRRQHEAILQKLCLSWLGLLVFGYLWGHTALFGQSVWLGRQGGEWVTLTILCAKFSDVTWVVLRKANPPGVLRLLVAPLGGALGGWAISRFGGALAVGPSILWGVIIGTGVGWGSEAFNLIVLDVAGEKSDAPLKSSMLFGFAFAAALAYHFVRYVS